MYVKNVRTSENNLPESLWNWLKYGGLEPDLSHAKKVCKASYFI